MSEGTILTAITAIVTTLAAVIGRLYLNSEARWEKAFEDLKATHAAGLVVIQADKERMSKQYEDQIDTLQADIRDYKDMLGMSIRSGKAALEVGVEQARRLGTGDR